jgi:hypothetical protein
MLLGIPKSNKNMIAHHHIAYKLMKFQLYLPSHPWQWLGELSSTTIVNFFVILSYLKVLQNLRESNLEFHTVANAY